MKETELKIGDLVLYKDKVLRVEEVSFGLCGGLNEDNFFIGDIPIENVKPIPLTEKILEENGWRYNRACLDFISSTESLKVYNDGKDYGVKKFSQFICKINYVHQLQHILWALGINDNLKV